MKINPMVWFRSSPLLAKAHECAVISSSDMMAENSPHPDLFSTPQLERYGQKLAHNHKLSPDKLPYYLLKRLGENEAVITQNCYILNEGKKSGIMPAGCGCWTTIT